MFVSDIEISRREEDVCTCEVSEKRVGCACDEGRAWQSVKETLFPKVERASETTKAIMDNNIETNNGE